MLTIIICIIVLLFLGFKWVSSDGDDSFDDYFIVGLCACGIGLVCGTIIALTGGAIAHTHNTEERTYSIVTMQDRPSIRGSWSLFGGSIHENMVYTFYVTKPDGTTTLEQIDANKVVLREDDVPNAVEIVNMKKENVNHLWFTTFNKEDWEWRVSYPIKITVPRGSIDRIIKLDAQ